MTQEEKQLLLKDLSARLPYGVMYETEYGPRTINDLFIYSNGPVYIKHSVGDYNEVYGIELEYIKPYLRPMSSMTEKEKKERDFYCQYKPYDENIEESYLTEYDMPDYVDWLNEHHFDYRGLIKKGLALEAPEGMYND